MSRTYSATVTHHADGSLTIRPEGAPARPAATPSSSGAPAGALVEVRLEGRVKKNWPPRSDRAPHKLVVEYEGEADWRTWLIWPDGSRRPTDGGALALEVLEGDLVVGYATRPELVSDYSGKPEVSLDRLEIPDPEPVGAGYDEPDAAPVAPTPTEPPPEPAADDYVGEDLPF